MNVAKGNVKKRYRLEMRFDFNDTGSMTGELYDENHDIPWQEDGTGSRIRTLEPGNEMEMVIIPTGLLDKEDGVLDIMFTPDGNTEVDPLSAAQVSCMPVDLENLEAKNLKNDHECKIKTKKNKQQDFWDITDKTGHSGKYYKYKISGELTVDGKTFSFDPEGRVGPYK